MTPTADFSRRMLDSCEVRFLRWERNVAVLFAIMATFASAVSAMKAHVAEDKLNRLREQPVRAACEFVNRLQ
jgi:hypothetical protein